MRGKMIGMGLMILISNVWGEIRFDGSRAFSFLEKQVSFGPRNPGSEGHARCLQYLRETLISYADTVEIQTFQYNDRFLQKRLNLSNIIARFQPEKSERIFLAAHWDTRPRADYESEEKKNQPIPGANDGASGVAVLLEIARILGQKPAPIGVDIILFDGEDYGRSGHLDEYFLGSRYFAENYHAGKYRHEFGILLDMVGDAQLELKKEGYSRQYLPDLVDRIWNLARSIGMYEFVDAPGPYIEDDHIPLLKKGISCIDIIDFAYPDDSHRYWHTLQDTPDKCSAHSLYVVGTVLLELIYGY